MLEKRALVEAAIQHRLGKIERNGKGHDFIRVERESADVAAESHLGEGVERELEEELVEREVCRDEEVQPKCFRKRLRPRECQKLLTFSAVSVAADDAEQLLEVRVDRGGDDAAEVVGVEDLGCCLALRVPLLPICARGVESSALGDAGESAEWLTNCEDAISETADGRQHRFEMKRRSAYISLVLL